MSREVLRSTGLILPHLLEPRIVAAPKSCSNNVGLELVVAAGTTRRWWGLLV
jgi:hypothetical protein